jgi:hypothetical protein
MKRYAEAADTYKAFDDYIAEYNIELSMDNLTEYGNKFEANYKADRRDSALAVAAYVFENIDSVVKKQKRNITLPSSAAVSTMASSSTCCPTRL